MSRLLRISDNSDSKAFPKRLNSLTSTRFFAATVVVVYHSLPLWRHFPITYQTFQYGYIGVTYFFILSGFVLTYSYYDKPLSQKKFTVRRIARIWPLHVLILTLCIAGSSLCHAPIAGIPGTSLIGTLLNYLLMHAWVPLHPDIRQGWNGVSWTLSVELLFYLNFVKIIKSLQKLSTKKIMILLFILWGTYGLADVVSLTLNDSTLKDISWFFPIARLPEFILGCGLAITFRRGVVLKNSSVFVWGG